MVLHESGRQKDSDRKSTNAVLTARRALSCLVDWYMQRDGFWYCKNFENSLEAKSEILLQIGVIDKLTSKVLKRIIDVRNIAEHKYQSINLDDAEDIVELLRRLCDSLIGISEPDKINAVWGHFNYGYQLTNLNGKYDFGFPGWSKECFVLQLTATPPWMGVVFPTSKQHAVVKRVFLKDVPTNLLIEVLLYVQGCMDKKNKRWRESDRGIALPKYFYHELCKIAGLI